MSATKRSIQAIGFVGALLLAGPTVGQEGGPPDPGETATAQPLRPERLLPPLDAAGAVAVDPALRKLADALADPSYARREAAMQTLMGGVWDVSQLCSLLSERLAPEQRFRLLTILRQQIDAPRGAVGISMQWQQPQGDAPGAVEVTDLVPGLPAEEVLLIGDHVTHIDGRPLNFMNDLRVIVQSRKPGEQVELTVRRAQRDENNELIVDHEGRAVRKEVQLTLRLGSASMLLDPQTGRPTPGGSVEDTRDREARLAVARYAPRPVVVEILGGEESGLVPAQPKTPVTEEEVEAHPIIQSMRQQKDRIAAGQIPMTPNRRLSWQLQLDRLNEMVTRPGLSEREIDLWRRVAERFAELLQDG